MAYVRLNVGAGGRGAGLSNLQNNFKNLCSSLAGEGLCKGHSGHKKEKHFLVSIIQITSGKLTNLSR